MENTILKNLKQFKSSTQKILTESLKEIYQYHHNNPLYFNSWKTCVDEYDKLYGQYKEMVFEKLNTLKVPIKEKEEAMHFFIQNLLRFVVPVLSKASTKIEYDNSKWIRLPFFKNAAKQLEMIKELNENGDYIVKYISQDSNSIYITDANGHCLGVTGKDISEAAANELYRKGYNIRYFDDKKHESKITTSAEIAINPFSEEIKSLVEYLKGNPKQKV